MASSFITPHTECVVKKKKKREQDKKSKNFSHSAVLLHARQNRECKPEFCLAVSMEVWSNKGLKKGIDCSAAGVGALREGGLGDQHKSWPLFTFLSEENVPKPAAPGFDLSWATALLLHYLPRESRSFECPIPSASQNSQIICTLEQFSRRPFQELLALQRVWESETG